MRRVFTTYAGEGDAATMAVTDFERLSADWSAARAIAHGRGRVLFRGAAAASAPLTVMLGGCKRALGWATETGLARHAGEQRPRRHAWRGPQGHSAWACRH